MSVQQSFRVGLVQMSMSPSPEANTEKAAAKVREAAALGADVVCLPELYRSPYFCQKEDASFFDLAEQVGRGLDNVEASLADATALPAAIRNVISLARLAVETYNRRSEAVTGSGK